mgnify:CR=1 FL=1
MWVILRLYLPLSKIERSYEPQFTDQIKNRPSHVWSKSFNRGSDIFSSVYIKMHSFMQIQSLLLDTVIFYEQCIGYM